MIFNAYQDSSRGIADFSVVSSGHIFAKHGRQVLRPAGRRDHLLFYVAKGCEHFLLGGGEEVAPEGSFILFRPNEPQIHTHRDERNGEFYYVHFNAPDGSEALAMESSRIYTAEPSTTVRDLFEEVISELQMKKHAYEKVCVAKLFCILALLERRTLRETSPVGRYSGRIAYVIGTMNKEYDRNRGVEDYAALCSMSKFHFLRVFKEITGKTPIEYRNKIRFDHAAEMLADTEIPINEIAQRVGFSSNIYFCDAFRKKMGLSPSQYRKLHRQEAPSLFCQAHEEPRQGEDLDRR